VVQNLLARRCKTEKNKEMALYQIFYKYIGILMNYRENIGIFKFIGKYRDLTPCLHFGNYRMLHAENQPIDDGGREIELFIFKKCVYLRDVV
jgi:hypothetical protein